jgi:hypothetical protein
MKHMTVIHVATALTLAGTCVAASAGLVPDYCPLAVGNEWEFAGAFGTKRMRVTAYRGDTVVIAESTFTANETAGTLRKYVSNDESGVVAYDIVIDNNAETDDIWGKHCLSKNDHIPAQSSLLGSYRQSITFGAPVTVPAGTFENPVTFVPMPFLIGRPHLIGPKSTIAPGVGPVVLQYSYLMDYEDPPVWRLSKYDIQPVPEGFSHACSVVQAAPGNDSLFDFARENADSGTLTFRVAAAVTSTFDATTSYRQPRECLRIYVTDTDATPMQQAAMFDHRLGLRNLRSHGSLDIEVYSRNRRQDNGGIAKYYGNSRLLYGESIGGPVISNRYGRISIEPTVRSPFRISTQEGRIAIDRVNGRGPQNASRFDLSIHTIMGKCIARESTGPSDASGMVLVNCRIPAGLYLVTVSAGDSRWTQRIHMRQ